MRDRVDGVKRAADKHAAGCGVALSYVPVVRSSQPIFFLPCLLRARPPNYRCPRSFPIRLLQSTTVLARTRRFLDSRACKPKVGLRNRSHTAVRLAL